MEDYDTGVDDAQLDAHTFPSDAFGFCPDRMVGHPRVPKGDLSVSTASCLIRAFAECPECGASLDPDVRDGLAEDRDVVFEARPRRFDPLKKTAPIQCDECGTFIDAFVEEAAQPRSYSTPDPKVAKYGGIFIEFEDRDGYMVTRPGDVRVSRSNGPVDRYTDTSEGADE